MKHRIVDRKAPRFRKTGFETRLSIIQLHKEYEEKIGKPIDKALFEAIYKESMAVIRHFAVTERNGVLLPEQMGNIHLMFFKPSRKVYSQQIGYLTGNAPLTNPWDENYLQGKICWDYRGVKYKLKDYILFSFTGTRELKTMASTSFKTIPEVFPRITAKHEERYKTRQQRIDEQNNQGSDKSTESTDQIS